MRVFGSANHSPDFLIRYLYRKLNVPLDSILIVSSGDTLARKTNNTHFIFLGSAALRRNLDTVNSRKYNGKVGIVCASPLHLHEFDAVLPLDYSESDNPHLDAFELGPIARRAFNMADVKVRYEKRDYTDVVQAKVESFTGILTQFMTFVYTTPSATHQKPIKELACTWLVSGEDHKVLVDRLETLIKTVPLTDKQQAKFLSLMTSADAGTYGVALQEAKECESVDSTEFKAVASKYAVSAYEMRYILSVASTAKCK